MKFGILKDSFYSLFFLIAISAVLIYFLVRDTCYYPTVQRGDFFEAVIRENVYLTVRDDDYYYDDEEENEPIPVLAEIPQNIYPRDIDSMGIIAIPRGTMAHGYLVDDPENCGRANFCVRWHRFTFPVGIEFNFSGRRRPITRMLKIIENDMIKSGESVAIDLESDFRGLPICKRDYNMGRR